MSREEGEGPAIRPLSEILKQLSLKAQPLPRNYLEGLVYELTTHVVRLDNEVKNLRAKT